MSFLANNCSLRLLNQSILDECDAFDCGHKDLNEFFSKDCIYYTKDLFGKTYCFTFDSDPKKIVCAFTLANDSIKAMSLQKSTRNKISRPISNPKRFHNYPAVLIGRLGVNKAFKRNGIGKELMDSLKAWFIDEENKTGCRFIIVDSYNEKIPLTFYKNNGFKNIFKSEEEEKEYLSLQTEDSLKTRLLYFDLIKLTK
ncbi:MAG: GNAT family N-acetyltransferase [Chitinophagales bacterium]